MDDNQVTPEYLERVKYCTFLPTEQENLLDAFYFKLTMDSFTDKWAKLWKEPDVVGDATELNPRWVTAERERRWLRSALAKIEPLAKKHALDTRPLLWLGRYITGTHTLTVKDKRDILDLVDLLGSAIADIATEPLPSLGDGNPSETTWTPAELARELGVSNRSINTYAKKANCTTPGRGKRNHRYSNEDKRAMFEGVISSVSSDQAVITKAKKSLKEMETKPKDGN